MNTVKIIEVRIWGQSVGAVVPASRTRSYAFEFTPAWIKKGIDLSPIQMPVRGRRSLFSFPELPSSYKGLPGLLADALPDDFGNALIDAWMTRHGHPRESITALDRLAYMGQRGMGALEFKPVLGGGNKKEQDATVQMKELVEEARKVLRGDLNGDHEAQAALANIIKVGTSAGGARAKAVIAWHPDSQEIRSGQFEVPKGFEHWLLKFDGVGKDLELGTPADYGRIEFSYHLMALAAGINMSPCRLLEENGRAHFMTKRFDRDGNTKHHIQSLCALDHLDYKQRATHGYEQLFAVIASLKLGDAALSEAFRRMVFNVVSRNCDDHTKNHAFLLKEGGEWELAPAFDITHAHNPRGEWTYQHMMGVNGRFDEIQAADLMAVATRFSVPRAKQIIDEVQTAVFDGWLKFAAEAGLTQKRTKKIADDFRRV